MGPGQQSGTGLYPAGLRRLPFAGTSPQAPASTKRRRLSSPWASSGGPRWPLRSRSSGATLDPAHDGRSYSGRRCCLGESVQLIDLNRRTGQIRLLPIATRPIISGGPAPESWRYEIKLPRPNGEDPLDIDQLPARNVGAEGIIHVRYMPYRSAPWQGVSPLQSAGFTAETLARIEKSLQDDAKVPTGSIMPQPDGVSPTGNSPSQGSCDFGQGRAHPGGNNRGRVRAGSQLCPKERLATGAVWRGCPGHEHSAMGVGDARGNGRAGCPPVALHIARVAR